MGFDSPANESLKALDSSDPNSTDHDSHDTERSHGEKHIISPAHAHANELLGHLFSEQRQKRCEVGKEVVGELIAAKGLPTLEGNARVGCRGWCYYAVILDTTGDDRLRKKG
jgi:hypothetical protein